MSRAAALDAAARLGPVVMPLVLEAQRPIHYPRHSIVASAAEVARAAVRSILGAAPIMPKTPLQSRTPGPCFAIPLQL